MIFPLQGPYMSSASPYMSSTKPLYVLYKVSAISLLYVLYKAIIFPLQSQCPIIFTLQSLFFSYMSSTKQPAVFCIREKSVPYDIYSIKALYTEVFRIFVQRVVSVPYLYILNSETSVYSGSIE